MTEQEKKDLELANEAKKLSDLDIADLANKELRKKETEISSLRKELAQARLYSVAEEEVKETLSREDCINIISDSRVTNYDYAEAVIALVDHASANGEQNPLGKNGNEVYTFFKNTIDECEDDKSRFTSVYQSRLGSDDTQAAMAYKRK